MRLSVIMPNRNHAALLPRALGALQCQTRQPDEIVVIDDASTDSSREVIRGFMPRLPQLRLLENPQRLGVVLTLNRGLGEATGEAVYFAASDDAIDPDFIRVVLGALEAHPTSALACAEARLISETGAFLGFRPVILPRRRAGYLAPEAAARLLRQFDNWILSVVAIYRRDLIMRSGGFDPTVGSFCDSYLARAMALESGFVFVPQVLGTWYLQAASVSRSASTDPAMMLPLIRIVQRRIEESEGRLYPPGYARVFARRCHFAAARLAVTAPEFDPAQIRLLAGQGPATQRLLQMIASWPYRPRQIAALGWLTLVLRPMSLRGLLVAAVVRSRRAATDRVPG